MTIKYFVLIIAVSLFLSSCSLAVVAPPPPETEPWKVGGVTIAEPPNTPEEQVAYDMGTMSGWCYFIAIPISFIGSFLKGNFGNICKLIFVGLMLFFIVA